MKSGRKSALKDVSNRFYVESDRFAGAVPCAAAHNCAVGNRFCSGFEKILATLLPEGLRASLNCRIENL
jgi:hypothetical protein